ncbi:MAG TPA: transglutaminase domain-containing protein [Puia sp.]|nr:transglutaminase domain-containing protein [Puia sp.]
MKKYYFTLLGIIFLSVIHGQNKADYKFGKITAANFDLAPDKLDSGANALIIFDIGSTQFDGNHKGFFTLIYTRFLRVKILNKNGSDIGNREIPLYHKVNVYQDENELHSENDAEKVTALKASTFNLENGIVTETKLDEKSVYVEKYNKEYDVYKFSLPALKEGSIFDLEYTVTSPYNSHMQSWKFQSEYPCLWSEYHVTIPPCFHYEMRLRGNTHFDVDVAKLVPQNFSIQEDKGASADKMINVMGNSIDKRWVKKNVPALHEQPYTTTLDNYNSMVSFQLDYFQWNDENERHDYMPTWTSSAQHLLQDENFGMPLNHENGWMSDELKNSIGGATSDLDKARRIFNYIRDNFKSINKEGYSKNALTTQNSLKEVFKNKQGNVAEINLLLIAMLRKADIDADPAILSTRDHGVADPSYPMIRDYNYVICIAHLGNQDVFLDASQSFNGFGHLTSQCYNGWAHIINSGKPRAIYLSPDSIKESRLTSVIIINDEKGKFSGAYKSTKGENESYDLRREIQYSSIKNYEKETQTLSKSDIAIENFGIDSLNNYDLPLSVHYDFELKNFSTDDIIYFNPLLNDGQKTNPFQSMERLYPVEMPYKLDQTYILNMDIPTGYQVDELPKSVRVAYNENEGIFEYLIQKGENNIQMRVHLKLNKAFFPVDEYSTLRDFFAFVVKKENEQIVFKKTH